MGDRNQYAEDLFAVLADALVEVAALVANDPAEHLLPAIDPVCEGGVCSVAWKPKR
jgi:hypothetical protein